MVEATKNQSSEQNTPATTEAAATEALASMTIKPEVEAGAATATAVKPEAEVEAATTTVNPEEEKKEQFIYHGMGNVQNKNTVQNLESRKATW